MSVIFQVARLLMVVYLGFAIQPSLSTQTQKKPFPMRSGAGNPPPISGKQLPRPLPPYIADRNKSPIIVLSIDGAAVRGIAQFEILLALEEKVNEALAKAAKAAGKGQTFNYQRLSITDMFDFFAGTSAGSVNVGAILIPTDYTLANTPGHVNKPKFTLDELKRRLPETLKAAFSTSTFRKLRTLQVPGVGGLLGSKFTAGPFEELLQELTGKARVSDFVKPAIITSYDLRSREIMNFSTYDACSTDPEADTIRFQPQTSTDFYRKDKNVFIWQAIRASSAAPVFYKPLELDIGGKSRALIDAGLFIMSPTLLAWIEAQKIYPDRPLVMISISSGTLKDARKVKTKGATAGSIPKVLQPTIETALEGQQALTDLMMRDLPNIKYHRLSFDVQNKQFDDTSTKNIQLLEESAKATIASPQFQIAVKDIVNAIINRREKLKRNPADFTSFICKAKKNFQQNLDLTQSTGKKKAAIDTALKKMEIASSQMGTPNKEGKRIVEFSKSAKDQNLKMDADKAMQGCKSLLIEGKTRTTEWATQNCNHVLEANEICAQLQADKAKVKLEMGTQCKNVRQKIQKSCRDLSATVKVIAKDLKTRNCPQQ